MPDGVFGEGRLVRWTLIALAVGFLVLFLVLPLLAVFSEALRRGAEAFFAAFDDADTQAAIRLTLLVAAIAVPLNLIFGLAAAWALGHTDRFAAAVVRRPIVDWATDVATRPDGAYRAAQWMRAMPWENPEQYVQRSPLFSAQNLKTPTLVLAGDPDPESEQLYFALRMKKVDAALVRLPEAERPGDVIAELETSLRWLQRFSRAGN